MAEGDLADIIGGDHGHLAGGQHLDVMVGDAEQRILQVDDVALHVDRQDLAAAIAGMLVAKGEAGQQQAGILRLVAVPDEILPGFEPPGREWQSEDRLAVGLRQFLPQVKLAHHRCEVGL